MMQIKILYEDNHLLGVEKPANVPVQEDASKDGDLLSFLKQYIQRKYNKKGEAFLGMVHRLDRPAGGAMVFARTSKAASRLSEQMRARKVQKPTLPLWKDPMRTVQEHIIAIFQRSYKEYCSCGAKGHTVVRKPY